MVTLQELICLLETARTDLFKRKAAIAQFQRLVWEQPASALPDEGKETLKVLAYDLDFFEPDPEVRRGDSTLYGVPRLESELLAALQKLDPDGSLRNKAEKG